MLSNTATPKYYGQFREKVLRGEIPINREIEMQMNLIDHEFFVFKNDKTGDVCVVYKRRDGAYGLINTEE